MDRKGAKPVMVGGLQAFAVASLLFVVGGDAHLLGAARFAQGAAAAAFSPAAGAAVAALGGAKRTGRLFGGYGGAKGVGYLLSPLVGGALVLAGGYRLLFAVLAAVAAVAAVAAAWFVPHIPAAPKVRSTVVNLMSQILWPEFLRPVLVLGAATAAVLQPYSGRRMDAGRIYPKTASLALAACAAGFVMAASFSSVAVVAIAAVLIGAGVAVATPLGFTLLARSAPAERMGRTMGAGEVGRELGDAGGPVLVGAFSLISLTAALGALALALLACAGLVLPRNTRPVPDRS